MLRRAPFAIFAVVLIAAAVFCYLVMPFSPVGQPMQVDRQKAPDGTEMLIAQTYTGTAEPYVVSFFVRNGEKSGWWWYYLDHQAFFWRGKIELHPENNTAVIRRGHMAIAQYNWVEGKFEWINGGLKTSTEAQGKVMGDPLSKPAK